jgi:hypothetical protein
MAPVGRVQRNVEAMLHNGSGSEERNSWKRKQKSKKGAPRPGGRCALLGARLSAEHRTEYEVTPNHRIRPSGCSQATRGEKTFLQRHPSSFAHCPLGPADTGSGVGELPTGTTYYPVPPRRLQLHKSPWGREPP